MSTNIYWAFTRYDEGTLHSTSIITFTIHGSFLKFILLLFSLGSEETEAQRTWVVFPEHTSVCKVPAVHCGGVGFAEVEPG